MKFIIAVDCEGPACVVGNPGKALSLSSDMPFARRQATREANACASALFDAGAEQVIIWDSHGQGINLLVDEIDTRCSIIMGKGFDRRFPELDESFNGVLMIGYHAMEGTSKAVLAHTYSSDAYKKIIVNGKSVGEITLDASVAGEFNVPLIFLSSDNYGCNEGLKSMPWIETVSTKIGLGRNCAWSKHPSVAEKEIYSGVSRAIIRLSEMKPFTFSHPVMVEIHYKKMIQTIKAKIKRPDWQIKNIRTIKKKLNSMIEWQC